MYSKSFEVDNTSICELIYDAEYVNVLELGEVAERYNLAIPAELHSSLEGE